MCDSALMTELTKVNCELDKADVPDTTSPPCARVAWLAADRDEWKRLHDLRAARAREAQADRREAQRALSMLDDVCTKSCNAMDAAGVPREPGLHNRVAGLIRQRDDARKEADRLRGIVGEAHDRLTMAGAPPGSLNSRIAALIESRDGAVKSRNSVQELADGLADRLHMVRTRLVDLGEDMVCVLTTNYADAISAMLFRRLAEAGVFPGIPATVRYKACAGLEWFQRVELEGE